MWHPLLLDKTGISKNGNSVYSVACWPVLAKSWQLHRWWQRCKNSSEMNVFDGTNWISMFEHPYIFPIADTHFHRVLNTERELSNQNQIPLSLSSKSGCALLHSLLSLLIQLQPLSSLWVCTPCFNFATFPWRDWTLISSDWVVLRRKNASIFWLVLGWENYDWSVLGWTVQQTKTTQMW